MCRSSVVSILLVASFFVGCDGQEERPPTVAERVAGTWGVARVEDGRRLVTQDFERTVGVVKFEFESVGCCAAAANYRLTITHPGGEVVELVQRYRVNDNPETPDYFVLFTGRSPGGILLIYDFGSPFDELTLTASGVDRNLLEDLAALGIDYPFQESVVLTLEPR